MYRPREIAAELGISPSTLRLWSTRFAPLLSDGARKDSAGTTAQRRYATEDIDVLRQAQQLLSRGRTYAETAEELAESTAPTKDNSPKAAETGPAFPATLPPVTLEPALKALRDGLEAKDAAISTLQDTLSFLDVYLKSAQQDRDAARTAQAATIREIDAIKAINRQLTLRLQRPWWKRLFAIG
jgi:DNA-binding transcriptional MerR regulator